MALEEKGRRYILTADISQLRTAFSNANKVVNDNLKQVRNLAKSLRFDNNNIDALKLQFESLNKAMHANVKRAEALKKQIRELENLRKQAFSSGSKKDMDAFTAEGGDEALKRLKVRLVEVQTESKKLRAEFEKVDDSIKNNSFNIAMDKINAELKETTNNSRSLANALKFDKNDVTTLKLQFENLSKVIELNELKAKELENQLQKSGNSAKSVERWKIELSEVRNETKQLRNELEKVDDSIRSSGFNAEMEKINSKIDKATQNVKELTRSINFKGHNITDTSNRFTQLGIVVENTRKKIELLDAQRVNVDVNSNEFVELGIKIDKANQEVKELTRSLSALERFKFAGLSGLTNGFDNMNAKVDKFAANMRNVGMQATMSLSMPIGYAGANVVRNFAEIEDAQVRTAAAASEGGETFGRSLELIKNASREAAKNTVYNSGEIAAGYEALVKAGWKLQDSSGKAGAAINEVKHVMNLAKLEGLDLATTSDLVVNSLTQFGMESSEAARLTDVLVAASNASTVSVTDLGESLKYAGPMAGALGFSIEDVSAVLAIMGNNGIKASVAGTALRTGFAELASNANKADSDMRKFGITILDNSGKMRPLRDILKDITNGANGLSEAQRIQAMETLFGKTAMSGWTAVAKTSNEVIDEMTGKMDGARGSAQKMADAMDAGFKGKLKKFTSGMQDAGAMIGEKMAPAIEKVMDLILKLANWIANLNPSILEMGAYIGSAVVAFGPLASAVGWLLLPFTKLIGLIKNFKTAIQGASTASAAAEMATLATSTGTLAKSVGSTTGTLGKFRTLLSLGGLINPWVAGLAIAGGALVAFNKTMEKVNEDFTESGKAQKAYASSVEYAGKSLDGLKTKLSETKTQMQQTFSPEEANKMFGFSDVVAEKITEQATAIANAQDTINEVIRNATAERRQLNEEEVASVISNTQIIMEEEAKIAQATADNFANLTTTIENFLNSDVSKTEAYVSLKAKYTNELNQQYDKAKQANMDWFEQALMNNLALPESERKATSEIEAELAKRNQVLDEEYAKGLNALIESTGKKASLDENYVELVSEQTAELKRLEEEKRKAIHEGIEGVETHSFEYQQILDELNAKISTTTGNIADTFGRFNSEHAAEWVKMIATAKEKGVALSDETKTVIDTIVKNYDLMPAKTKESFDAALKEAGLSLDSLKELAGQKSKAAGEEVGKGVKEGIEGTDTSSSANKLLSHFYGGMNRTSAMLGNAAGRQIGLNTKTGIDSIDFTSSGSKIPMQVGQGITNNAFGITSKIDSVMNLAKFTADTKDFSSTGSKVISDINTGLTVSGVTTGFALQGIVGSAHLQAQTVDGSPTGAKAINDVYNGILSGKDNLINTHSGIMQEAHNAAQAVDGSPVGVKGINDIINGANAQNPTLSNTQVSLMESNKNAMTGVSMNSVGTKHIGDIMNGANGQSGNLNSTHISLMNSAKGAASGVSFYSVGSDIVSGIAAGINSGWGWLQGVVGSLAGSMLSAAKSALGIFSPSRKFRDIIGVHIPSGIGVGINKARPKLLNDVKSMSNAMLDTAKQTNFASAFNDTFSTTFSGNTKIEHSVQQNNLVLEALNSVADRINNLELRSDVILSGQKVGEITYREHQNIERRMAY